MAVKWISEFTVPADGSGGIGGVNFDDQAAVMYAPVEDDPLIVGDDGCFYIRLHSWDERADVSQAAKHSVFRSFMGRRVRVTVETIDDDPSADQSADQP